MDIQMADIENFEQMQERPMRRLRERRPISRAERIRRNEKRRRIARRRRIKRVVVRLGILAVMLVTVVCIFIKVLGMIAGLFITDAVAESVFPSKLLDDDMNILRYEVSAPQVIEENEIKDKLLNLSEKYPEFQEIYDYAEVYPDKLLSSLCNNPEMIDFVKGYPGNDGTVTGGLTKKELNEGIPLLLQWDKRWGYAAYGDNDIALSGCAPTCLSMVIVGLTGNKEATPDAVADYAMENGFYVEGTGTAWSIMTEGGQQWNICGQELPLMESNVMEELENGHPIICSVKAGDFTTSGHFIVLIGAVNGKIRVNDPNSIARSSHLWDYSTLEGQISNLWVFYNN